MGVVAKFLNDLTKAIPVLITKVCTVLLLIFTLGMLLGFAIATANINPAVFLIPVAAMVVMWYKLDEGMLLLVILLLLIFLFPEVLNSLFSTIL